MPPRFSPATQKMDKHAERREQRRSPMGHPRSTREEELDEREQRRGRDGVGACDLGESMIEARQHCPVHQLRSR